jgi:hypothetical protein
MRSSVSNTNVALPELLHSMSASSLAASMPIDGRQSTAARGIARGTTRLLHALGFCALSELTLPSGRRADLVAIGASGEIWIIEIKSSVADLRADRKWMHYRAHCDRLFFATATGVPCALFPSEAGLIFADAFGASIVLEAPQHALHASARKRILLGFGRTAALRLSVLCDSEGRCGSSCD